MSPASTLLPRVVVLMSTYQGERFVAEQLRSILDQLPPAGLVMVRDDGSRDYTAAIIESMADRRITLIRGHNLGFSRSFLTLLTLAPPDADMVMFSDQDDVWLPGKIERAWRHLRPLNSKPALYGSTQLLVDVELRPLHRTRIWSRPPSFANALMENMITGCTAAINRPAAELLKSAGVPADVHLHDWWLYLVVSAFGTVVFDSEPTLLYRQHGANQIGHGAGWLGRHRMIVRFLRSNDWVGILLGQISALRRHFGDRLDPDAAGLLQDYFSTQAGRAVPGWRLILGARRWREGIGYELMLRVLLALHRLRIWPPANRRL
jgi:glycosyltransferase involved in cell wall biosynthesis